VVDVSWRHAAQDLSDRQLDRDARSAGEAPRERHPEPLTSRIAQIAVAEHQPFVDESLDYTGNRTGMKPHPPMIRDGHEFGRRAPSAGGGISVRDSSCRRRCNRCKPSGSCLLLATVGMMLLGERALAGRDDVPGELAIGWRGCELYRDGVFHHAENVAACCGNRAHGTRCRLPVTAAARAPGTRKDEGGRTIVATGEDFLGPPLESAGASVRSGIRGLQPRAASTRSSTGESRGASRIRRR
jgi:hypothetical protein